MSSNPNGRPTKMTKETIGILEEAFLNGATDRQACFQASISIQTLYNYGKENDGFLERKESLKEMTKYRAKINVSKAIEEGDKGLSQWYLERKGKDEGFSTRIEQTGADGKELIPDNSMEMQELTKQLNAIHRGASITGDGEPASTVGTEAQNKE